MHKNTPQSQSSAQSHSNKNSKKHEKTPYRSRINVKNRKQRNIPQIKIELDQMLSQAFYQLQMQPKKNSRIGPNQLYILDNQILRDYVEAIYSQYGIQDPLAKTEQFNDHFEKNRSKSNFGSRPTTYQTPQKFTHEKQQSSHKPKDQKRQNKTAERLSKLKKNFQQQLSSPPKMIVENQTRTTHKKMKLSPPNSASSNSKPGSTNKKQQDNYVGRKPSDDGKKNSKAYTSHLLTKTKYKYCLMCQKPLEADLINSHERDCQHLQRLLNTPNLKIQQILLILDNKITNLQNQISYSQQFIYEDINNFNSIANQILQGSTHSSLRGSEDGQEQSTLLKAFSMLNVMKCAELLDKLVWFRKMRGKAEIKRQFASQFS